MAKDLEYYLAQARRISKHREADAEKEIRKLYKSMLKELQAFVADAYTKYAEDDKLAFAMLQKAGYDARFLSEIEERISVATPKAAKELRQLVNDTYKIAYDGMVDAVVKSGNLDKAFADAVAITPHQIKKIVKNPIMDLALEKNHKDIIYDIKQAVAVGLMNGDRYTDMAHRISEKVDGAYYKSVRIARTEAHRVIEAGNSDAAIEADKEFQNGTTGMRMVKTWKTMRDERVRPQRRRKGKGGWSTKMGKGANHMKLEGQVVLAGEDFDLLDGNKASAPGQSGVAGHDINCRCYVSYEMMTDAEFYAKTGKHFPNTEKKPIAYTLNDKFSDVDADAFYNALEAHYKSLNFPDSIIRDTITRFRQQAEFGQYKNSTVRQALNGILHLPDKRQRDILDKLNASCAVKVKNSILPKPTVKPTTNQADIDKRIKIFRKKWGMDGDIAGFDIQDIDRIDDAFDVFAEYVPSFKAGKIGLHCVMTADGPDVPDHIKAVINRSNTIAGVSGRNLYYNARHLKDDTLGYVTTHELTHRLTSELHFAMSYGSGGMSLAERHKLLQREIFERAGVSLSTSNVEKYVSRYATTNGDEFLSEAMAKYIDCKRTGKPTNAVLDAAYDLLCEYSSIYIK